MKIYGQFTCPDGNHKRIGQTDRQFETRFKERVFAFTNNSCNSKCAQQLLDNGHALGPVDIIKVLYITNNDNRMPSIGKYYVYKKIIRAVYV